MAGRARESATFRMRTLSRPEERLSRTERATVGRTRTRARVNPLYQESESATFRMRTLSRPEERLSRPVGRLKGRRLAGRARVLGAEVLRPVAPHRPRELGTLHIPPVSERRGGTLGKKMKRKPRPESGVDQIQILASWM